MLKKIKALKDKIIRVARKELTAIFKTLRPTHPNPTWIKKQLNLKSSNEIAQYFGNKSYFPIFGFIHSDKTDTFKANFQEQENIIIQQADHICAGQVVLHGFNYSKNKKTQWHTDPVQHKTIPIKYARYYRFNTLDPFPDGSIDPILLFKLHTHQHLCRLAQAYYLTNDNKYIQTLVNHIETWMELFPIGHGYPYLITLNVAQRLISWCVIFSFVYKSVVFSERLLPCFLHSLYLQAEFIYKHLSTVGQTNNFLLAECVALLMVSRIFPEMPNARKLEQKAIQLLKQELPKQILSDGVSFEKSMGYQRFVAELLILIEAMNPHVNDSNKIAVGKDLHNMLLSMLYLSGPSGDIPQLGDFSLERAIWLTSEESMVDISGLLGIGSVLFNDSSLAWGARRSMGFTYWLLGERGVKNFNDLAPQKPEHCSQLFKEGGFAALYQQHKNSNMKAVIDCGAIGLAGEGGHGHNDILSFVLWANDLPVFVDPGTYTYFSSRAWRDKFRSIASHNTLQIDRAEPAKLGPGLFQIGKCLPPRVNYWHEDKQGIYFFAEHTRRHENNESFTHSRRFFLSNKAALFLNEQIKGKGEHVLIWHFHCDPSIQVTVINSHTVKLQLPNNDTLDMVCIGANEGKFELQQGWHSPHYGKKVKTIVVVFSITGMLPLNVNFVVMSSNSRVTQNSLSAEIKSIFQRNKND